ncbi:unnamed protein product, partial [Brassica oleracea]
QLASTLFSADLHDNKFRGTLIAAHIFLFPKPLSLNLVIVIIHLNCWKITFT